MSKSWKYSTAQLQEIKRLREQGTSYHKIGELLGIKGNSVAQLCRRYNLNPSVYCFACKAYRCGCKTPLTDRYASV